MRKSVIENDPISGNLDQARAADVTVTVTVTVKF